eukprot:2688244-Amphidinium_carterae.1
MISAACGGTWTGENAWMQLWSACCGCCIPSLYTTVSHGQRVELLPNNSPTEELHCKRQTLCYDSHG